MYVSYNHQHYATHLMPCQNVAIPTLCNPFPLSNILLNNIINKTGLHQHMLLFPSSAQVTSLVGWLKLVILFFFRPFAPWEGCCVCWEDEDRKHILLCDKCDAEYHIYCLDPPLEEVPEGKRPSKPLQSNMMNNTFHPSPGIGSTLAVADVSLSPKLQPPPFWSPLPVVSYYVLMPIFAEFSQHRTVLLCHCIYSPHTALWCSDIFTESC